MLNDDRYRRGFGTVEGLKENNIGWVSFFRRFRGHGLEGVKIIVGDKGLGMLVTVEEVFPNTKYQRSIVHFYRNLFSVCCILRKNSGKNV